MSGLSIRKNDEFLMTYTINTVLSFLSSYAGAKDRSLRSYIRYTSLRWNLFLQIIQRLVIQDLRKHLAGIDIFSKSCHVFSISAHPH